MALDARIKSGQNANDAGGDYDFGVKVGLFPKKSPKNAPSRGSVEKGYLAFEFHKISSYLRRQVSRKRRKTLRIATSLDTCLRRYDDEGRPLRLFQQTQRLPSCRCRAALYSCVYGDLAERDWGGVMNNLFEKLQAKARAGRKPVAAPDPAPGPAALPATPETLETPAAQVDARRAAEMTAEAAGDAARARAAESGVAPGEIGGPRGLEPTRFGDWEKSGRCVDF